MLPSHPDGATDGGAERGPASSSVSARSGPNLGGGVYESAVKVARIEPRAGQSRKPPTFAPGSLVSARGREWVVLPDSVDDLVMLRPLGGTDDEVCGILPELEEVRPASFSWPSAEQPGDFRSAKLLRQALRLGFRSSAGPFRSFGSIAVEPRPYQVRSEPWEGEATVSVTVLHMSRGPWPGKYSVDGRTVTHISPALTEESADDPIELPENRNMAFAGTNILGTAFTLSADQRQRLLRDEPSASSIIKAFYGGRALVGSADPTQPSRWIIDFGKRSLAEAGEFPLTLAIVEEKVKPERLKANEPCVRYYWWQYGRPAAALYQIIDQNKPVRVIAIPEVSKHMRPVWLPARGIYQHTLVIFPFGDYFQLAYLPAV